MSGQAQPQPSQQGPGQQRQYPELYRVEDLQKFTFIDQSTKAKYAQAFKQMWTFIDTKPSDSAEFKQAYDKLKEWTAKLIAGEKSHRQRAAQEGANRPQSSGQAMQPQQQQPQQQQQQQQPPQQQQPGQQRPPQAQNAPGQQPNLQPQQSNVPPAIWQHVQNFPYALPPNIPSGTQEADNKIKEYKNTYLLYLHQQEQANAAIKQLNAMIEQRKGQGQEIPQELMNRRQAAESQYNQRKQFVDEFRKRQSLWKQQAAQQATQQAQTNVQVKTEPGAAPPNIPPSQQFQLQMPSQNQQPSQQGQGAPATTAAASQVNARATQSPATNAQPQQGQPFQPSQQPQQHVQQPQQQQQQQPTNMAGNMNQPRPQLPPHQPAPPPNHVQHNSPHPQPNPNGPPVPLSHQAAMSAAQRSYSDQQRTPQQMTPGQYGGHMGNREQLNNPKMPIPKQLNVPPPQPVSMGPARPTMGGAPGNGAPGMMGQPVIPKIPQFQLEGDGDRVLSKKKLDELVRQVTSGGEGPGGESLAPDVEETMLALADDFVDNVISTACKLAKLRDSPQLDIRDIQLVLERNYNIRVPGYAADETRTVRKLHPAPGWTQKMNAVQAAKVMGGKTDI